MIFKTFDNDIDKWTAKIGIFGKSFNELGAAVNKAFEDIIDNIDNFDEDISFWDALKDNLAPKTENGDSWIKNTLGEIISADNINSYIKELDLDSAKEQVKSIFNYKQLVDDGKATWQDYFDTLKDGSEHYIPDLIKNTNDLSKLTGEDLVKANQQARQSVITHNDSLKEMTLGAKAGQIALKGLSIAGNMLAMWAISKVITGLYKLTQVSKDVANSASEIGSTFSSTKSDIEDYRQEVEELYETINDSSSSISEVTDARKQLMSIQDELIEKYGTEQSSIDAITKAIKGETNAWEELTETKWQELKNKFNDGDGGFVNNISNFFSGYKDNLARMDAEYGTYSTTIDVKNLIGDNEIRNQVNDILEEFGGLKKINGQITFSGNATEVYEQLLKIQQFFDESDIKTGNNFDTVLTRMANNAKDVSEKYKDMYDQYILNEKILKKDSKYADAFKDITDAYNDYQDAIETNDEEKVQKAKDNLFKDISDEMAEALENGDEDVADYFRSMYPELQEEISTWEFKIKFEANTDDLKTDVGNIFGEDGAFKGKSKEGIIDFDYKTASDEERQAYGKLEGLVEKYHLSSIEELLNILESYGIVQSMDYQELVDKWGKNNVEKIDKEDLQYAYTIEPAGDMTFEQFQKEIVKAKKEDSKLKETTRSGMISKLNNLSEGFEELDKIYASILDKDAFDFKLLDDDKFKETFSSLDNYADFVETVTSNPNDINACKDAFSKLVTEWITGTKVLDYITEDNEKLTAAMLKQMGVANADEVTHYALEKAKAKEFITTSENIDVTEDGADALIAEANAAGINTNAFLEMITQEILFNNTELDTESKCQKILAIAQAAGIASTSFSTLKSQIEEWASKDKIGSGTRTSTAQDIGLTVKGKKERGAEEYKKHGNLYIATDGTEFEDYEDAMYYQESLNNINNMTSAFEYNTLKYTGGSTSQDKAESIEDSKEKFDWIERAVKKVQRVITNLGKTVSATYKTWTTRNSALTQEIAEVNNELTLQQQAYEKYMALAESVGLSSYYKNQVQNGSLSIDSVSDDDLKEKIKEYQDFYDKALSAADAVQDLQDQLAELGKSKFQNKLTQYEKELAEIEDYKKSLESMKSLLETQGYVMSHNLYTTLAELEKDNIENLKEEYEALTNSLNYAMANGVEKYSDDWYDMCSQIQDVNEQIISANTNLAELINQLRELDWELFDTKQDRISQITSESDWLIDLMSNKDLFDEDSGAITEQGKATLGLHAINYNTYMSQADDYAEELLKINEQIANDPNNTNLLEHREELLESQRDMIDAAEDEKQAIKDLISEGYDNYLNALQEVIDKRKDAMDQIKDLYDYEKNISELNKDITILEKQEMAFRGNDSEEGMAKWQEIQASLEEARQNLEETEYERYIDDQQKMLDTLYEDAEQWVNERLDNQELLIQNVIDEANNNAESIKETLEKEVRDVGSVLSDNMMNILSPDSNVGQIVSMYGDNFNTYANTTVNTLLGIKAGVDAMLADSGIKVNTNIEALKLSNPYTSSGSGSSSTTDSSSTSSSTSSSSSSNSGWGSWFISKKNSVAKSRLHIDTSIVDRLKYFDYDSSENARAKYYKSMGGSGEYYGTAKQNRWMIQQMRNNGFKQGGLIGEAIRNSGEDGFILARTGEEVLSLEKIAKLKETLNLVNPLADTVAKLQIKLPDIQPRDSVVNQEVHMNFELHDVTNGEQLLDFVKNDKRFIKTIQQETIGAMMGQNSLGRYKY